MMSTGGLLLGSLLFAASFTPSLLPRTFVTQGVLSGCSMVVGYGLGVFGVWLWTYLDVVRLNGRLLRVAKLAAATGCAIITVISLWQAARWQNSIRELMHLEPIGTAHPLEASLIALAVFAVLVALARFFRMTIRFVATRASRFLPERVSNVIGVVAALALFWVLFNGILFRGALRVAEASFQEYDALIEPETKPPADPLKTGSSASLLGWTNSVGRDGSSSRRGRPAKLSARLRAGRRSSPFASMSGYARQTRRKSAPDLGWRN